MKFFKLKLSLTVLCVIRHCAVNIKAHEQSVIFVLCIFLIRQLQVWENRVFISVAQSGKWYFIPPCLNRRTKTDGNMYALKSSSWKVDSLASELLSDPAWTISIFTSVPAFQSQSLHRRSSDSKFSRRPTNWCKNLTLTIFCRIRKTLFQTPPELIKLNLTLRCPLARSHEWPLNWC